MTNQGQHLVRRSLIRLIIAALLGMSPMISLAQTTDITGSGLNTVIHPAPNGTTFNIDGGTRFNAGPNLYHSFGDFSLATGHTAMFRNVDASGAAGTGFAGTTANIFGRVTGGHPSSIFGTIDSARNFPQANLWLINPAGMVFGPTASINVGGSANFSTADYLRMSNDALFFASPNQATTLSVAPAVAFGFLGANPGGTISIQGGAFNGTPSITLVGRDLKTANTTTPGIVADNGGSPGLPVMSGNVVNLISVGQPADPVVGGEVKIAADFTFSGFGTSPGGNILISSGQISTTGGFTAVTPQTGTVIFSPSANINNTIGNGGINIQTGTFFLQGDFFTASFQQTISGPTMVTATKSITLDGGSIQTSADAALGGPGQTSGSITLTSPSVTLTEGAQLLADVIGAGFGGNITLNVGTLSLSGNITSKWDGGTVNVGRAGDITIQGLGGPNSTATLVDIAGPRSGIFATTLGAAPGGSILVNSQNLSLSSETEISSSTFSTGNAGNITLNVGTLTAAGHSAVASNSELGQSITGGGNAGNIAIQGIHGFGSPATNVSLDNSTISTTIARGTSSSIPATIDITAQAVNLTNGAQIKADTSGAAPAGDITLNVGTLTTGSSTISSSSSSTDPEAGNAGSITIQGTSRGSPATNVSLDNSTISTTIAGGTSSTTPATIDITAQTVNLANGSQISADTNSAAPAGNITFNVGTLTAGHSKISSSSGGTDSTAGNAGTITIQGLTGAGSAATEVRVDSSRIKTAVLGGTADSRRAVINLAAELVEFTNTASIGSPSKTLPPATLETTTFGPAPAGNIAIHTNTLLVNVNPDGTPIVGARRVYINSPSGRMDGSILPTAGPAGSITISGLGSETTDAAKLVAFDNTQISSAVEGGTATTTPAAITITADTMAISGTTGIFASTIGAAPAGNIAFHVNTLRANVSPDGTLIGGPRLDLGCHVCQSFVSTLSGGDDSTAGASGTITISGLGPEVTSAAKFVALNNTEFSSTVKGGTATTSRGSITMRADALSITNSPKIMADTSGAASAGNITFNATNLTIDGATKMTSSTSGPGRGGDITITGSSATVGGTIAAETSGSGAGGVILANVGTLHLTNGANLSSRSTSTQVDAGDAGQIGVRATGTFQSDGSTVVTSAAQGKGGPITVSATDVVLTNGTLVSSQSTGAKGAGSIALTSTTDLLMRNSTVTTSATQASGGDIKLTAPHIIRLVDSNLKSSVQGDSTTKGGNITIDPQFVVIQNSQLLANANVGAGGNITITATGAVLVDPNSLLSATAGPAGVSGSVNINAPIQVLSGALVPLNLAYNQAGLSGDRCAADPNGRFSSFVQVGRDGVPQTPGNLTSSPLGFLDGVQTSSLGTPGQSVSQIARLGLFESLTDETGKILFYSGCRS